MRRQKHIRRLLRNVIGKEVNLFAFSISLFIVGIVFGAVVVDALSADQKSQLFQDLHGFLLTASHSQSVPHGEIVWNAAFTNIKLIALIWILGLSIIGLPFIVFLIFLKGFVVGFSVGFLVDQFSLKGIWFASAAVLPQNMLIVPSLLVAGVAGISFSLSLIRSRFADRSLPLYPMFMSYTALIAGLGIVMVGAAMIEGHVSPRLMELIASRLG